MTYDTTPHTVTITVTLNEAGELEAQITGLNDGVALFKNAFDPPPSPPTTGGDPMIAIAAAAVMFTAAGVCLAFRRRKSDED